MSSRVRMVAVCLAGIAFNALVFGPALELTAHGINDFMSVYSGTHLQFTSGMYDVDANLAVQRETAGWENVNRLFLRPPFVAMLAWPLGQMPFLLASHIWEVLIVAAIILFCRLWPGDRRMAALACCWSLPLFYVFANGQDVAFLLILIALALREIKRGRDTAAGLLFSLCSIKFHLFLLLPLLIAGQKRWRFLRGLAAGGAVLFLLSFAPGGGNWPLKYIRILRNPIGNPWPDAMPSVHGLTAGLPHGDAWQALGTLVIALLVWLAVRKGGFEYGLAAVLAGGILVSPHTYLADCALAIPAILITLPAAVGGQRGFERFLLSPFCSIWVLVHPAWIMTLALTAYVVTLAGVPSRAARSLLTPLWWEGSPDPQRTPSSASLR